MEKKKECSGKTQEESKETESIMLTQNLSSLPTTRKGVPGKYHTVMPTLKMSQVTEKQITQHA